LICHRSLCTLDHGRPQTFFQGRSKFSRGGAKTYYLPKKCLKTYYFHSKKSKNILYWPAKGGGEASAPSCPPLRTPMANTPPKKVLKSKSIFQFTFYNCFSCAIWPISKKLTSLITKIELHFKISWNLISWKGQKRNTIQPIPCISVSWTNWFKTLIFSPSCLKIVLKVVKSNPKMSISLLSHLISQKPWYTRYELVENWDCIKVRGWQPQNYWKIFRWEKKQFVPNINSNFIINVCLWHFSICFGPFIKWLKLSLFVIIYEQVTFTKERKK